VDPAVITGFNTNIRHRGRLFHVQTEDSGRSNPHVISHLYFGGTILASQKTDYADQVESENLDPLVRELMENQHKSLLKRLRAGDFDETIHERLGGETPDGSTTSPSIHDDPPPAASPAPSALADVVNTTDPGSDQRVFGDAVATHKPLDEVILEYLVKKARDRGGRTTKKRAGDSRSRG
jgi:hypothetical protein